MKFKHVFRVWILADLFLAIGLAVSVLLSFSSAIDVKDLLHPGFFLIVVGWGVVLSLPSLIAMMIFHHFYTRNNKQPNNYVQTYLIVILIINLLYVAVNHTREFNLQGFDVFYIFSTLAGWLALFFVDRRIKRTRQLEEEQLQINGENI